MLLDTFARHRTRRSRLLCPVFVLLFTIILVASPSPELVQALAYRLGCAPDPVANGAELVRVFGAAAASSADDTINLARGCTYTLAVVNNGTDGGNGLPLLLDVVVSGRLNIRGNGATINRSSAPGTPDFRIMEVLAGADLTLTDVTISNGVSVPLGSVSFGGGIANAGSLTLNTSTISNNITTGAAQSAGGGIFNFGGNIILNNSTLSGNTANGVTNGLGGGVYNGGTMLVNGSSFSLNTATGAASYGGGIFNGGELGIGSGSSIRGNTVTGSTGWGGGIYNTGGNLTINDSTISENSVSSPNGNGGGIGIFNGTATVTNSTLSGNFATGSFTDLGGGIHNNGTLNVVSSVLSGNYTSAANTSWGGGIYNSGTLMVSNGSFEDNYATGDSSYGGGIYNHRGSASIMSTDFSRNTLTGTFMGGGGISNSSNLTVTNSTFQQNDATNGSFGVGGGIYNGGTIRITNSTLNENNALEGGGIFNGSGVTLYNSIIANSTGGGDCANYSTFDARRSLIEDGLSCISGVNVNNLTGDPGLDSSLNLTSGSIAINAGNNTLIPDGVTTDKAGNPRIVDGVVDLGAFEWNSLIVPTEPRDGNPTQGDAGTLECDNLDAQSGGSLRGSGGHQNAAQDGERGNSYCHIIALDGRFATTPQEIGVQQVIDLGVIHAVDVAGLLPNGLSVVRFDSPVRICMRGTGEVLFLNAASPAGRTIERLAAASEGGYTCADVPNAGTLVLVRGTSGQQEPPPPAPAITTLGGVCRVTTTDAPLNLRAEPNTSAPILGKLPYDLTLTATARVPGWFRVIYLDMQGWVSDTYLTTVGDCGA